jgi:hypothetical protein
VLRTHTLLMRPPFSPFGALRRLNATDASFTAQRRTAVVPLLGPSGEVDLLLAGDQSELFVSGDKIAVMPVFEPRRYYGDGAGLTGVSLPGGRALLLGDARRRLALEDHGPGPVLPPLYIGLDRYQHRRRFMALARRDDGTLGVLVADGGAPETAGVAEIDRVAGTLRPVTRLAPWSTALTADDPRCKKGADPRAWQALLVIDPSTWLALDESMLPGVTLAYHGLLRVRWGAERVCVEAIDAAARDAHRRSESNRSWSLVARWTGDKDRGAADRGGSASAGAALRAPDLRQEIVCRIVSAPRGGAG